MKRIKCEEIHIVLHRNPSTSYGMYSYMSGSGTFQILALDGGDIKGLFSAAVLAALEEDLQVNVSEHFDLIVGTSTGGIIALALGFGVRPHEVVDFYLNDGKKIFNDAFGVRGLQHWFRRKYSQKPLKRALVRILGEKTLKEANKRLVIPSYNLGEDEVYLFKTPHHSRLTRDERESAWKVALATSAAPTYFPASKHVGHIRHIDGGVWANNPIMVGITEAYSMLNVPLNQIKVLNIGTTTPLKRRRRNLDWGGQFLWAPAAADVIMRAQSCGAYAQSLHLLPRENVVRLDPTVPDNLFSLDKARSHELMAKARHESRTFSPTFTDKFREHRAQPYYPSEGPS